ncbi:MAG TPA: VOC family protein [Candidatus Dormibacteraeota bacterium]|nr:VOC family protein [Candidatus Dormibacteraeota bacterium]
MPRPRLEVGIDCLDPLLLAPFWMAALGYWSTTGDGRPYLDLVGPPGSLPVFLQRVPERKVVKNRLHLDLFSPDPEALCRRLEAFGAQPLGEPFGAAPAWAWRILADPEGNEFCVCREVRKDPDPR